MTKHTAMIFLSVLVVALPVSGLPRSILTIVLVLVGTLIAVLAYLSSVVYCSNCKKLIDEAEHALDAQHEGMFDDTQKRE